MRRLALNDLDAVLAIARRGSFRAAAVDLGMSTTALSHAVAGLEARLGVRLFNRTTRSVSLTDAGRGVRAEPETPNEFAARALSDALLAELRAADIIVIGAPMYNFSIPTSLRSWFDHVLRAGETFRYTEAGPEGLLREKKVIVVESRGGLYSEGPAQAADFPQASLRHTAHRPEGAPLRH